MIKARRRTILVRDAGTERQRKKAENLDVDWYWFAMWLRLRARGGELPKGFAIVPWFSVVWYTLGFDVGRRRGASLG